MGLTDRQWLQRLNARSLVVTAQAFLALLLAFAVARLVWALLAPIGPVGSPPAPALSAKSDASVLGRFDPFFQMVDGGPTVVSDLAIDLYGTRVDNVSGRGSAIIGVDGTQRSFVVGEEIMAGVTLHSVAFDSVTVSRGGSLEQLFLDQSVPARAVAPEPAAAAETPPVQVALDRLGREIAGELVQRDGKVEGLALKPVGSGGLFNEIGLKAGDVLLAANGARIDADTAPASIANLIGDNDVAVLEIRRGAGVQTVTFEIVR